MKKLSILVAFGILVYSSRHRYEQFVLETAWLTESCTETPVLQMQSAHSPVVEVQDAPTYEQLLASCQPIPIRFLKMRHIISESVQDTIDYTREKITEILKCYPILYHGKILSPDTAYWQGRKFKDCPSFGSEAGQDGFMMLYGHFLKNRENSATHWKPIREHLILTYLNLNHFFGVIQHGGTFFGHQSQRIYAYAEYDLYLFHTQPQRFKSKPQFQKRKDKFIQKLKLLAEKHVEHEYTDEERASKIKHQKKLLDLVKAIQTNLTNEFYLVSTQHFFDAFYQHILL